MTEEKCYINHYVLLEGADPKQWVALPRWTEIDPETGRISNSSDLNDPKWMERFQMLPKGGFWDGLPWPWVARILRVKGETGEEEKTVLWERKP